MAIIYETENFILESHEKPEVDRLEGGHLKISPKHEIEDRTKLTPQEAIELMRLTLVSGEAMKVAMGKQGIKIGRINYQDNGNWKPSLHVHLYGRAIDAKVQKFRSPIIPGHQVNFAALNDADIRAIRDEVDRLLREEKFLDSSWCLERKNLDF